MPADNYQLQVFAGSPVPSWQAISSFQSFSINCGRQKQLDQYNADTGIGEAIYFYGLNYGDWVPGANVRIYDNTLGYALLEGQISDVEIQYGIPFNGTYGFADRIYISIEGQFARAARSQGASYSMTAGSLTTQLATATTQSGTTMAALAGSTEGSTGLGATTVSSTWGDWINRVCLTLNARLRQSFNGLLVIGKYDRPALAFNFSDTTNNSTNRIYQQIQFTSFADNFYTQASVVPESFPTQTVQTGSAPYRTYTVNTLNNSASQALDYANFLLNNYKTPLTRVASISCTDAGQSSKSFLTYDAIGCQTSVAFRGTTYVAIVEGVTVSGTPSQAFFTYHVSAADLNAYLILDNATFGTLDFNRLGY
jgi:hypothetical protein